MSWLSVVVALTRRIKRDIELHLRALPPKIQGFQRLHVQHGSGDLSYAVDVVDGQANLVLVESQTGAIIGNVCLQELNDTHELAAVADALETLSSEVSDNDRRQLP